MTLTQLNYLVALATHRHFGRAAEACHVSQPTLSMQLQKLEDELGVTLIDRSLQPIGPTGIGERIVEQARIVLAERDRIPAMIAEVAEQLTGQLHLGIIPTLAPYLMPLVAGPFGERYPRIDLVVHEMTTQPLLDALGTDRIDAGFIATEESQRGLESRPLFQEPFVAYVGREHPLAEREAIDPDDLPFGDLWLLDQGHCLRDQVLQLCNRTGQSERTRRMRFESGNLETLRHLVDRVGGITLMPYLSTLYLDTSSHDHLRPFAAPIPRRTVRVIHRRASLRHALVGTFTSVVEDEVGPHLKELGITRTG